MYHFLCVHFYCERSFSSHIYEASNQLGGLINDLLDLSKIESKEGFSLNLELANLIECLKEEINLFEIQGTGHDFTLEILGTPYEILMDSVKMGQVFRNLFSNSVKYSESGGVISTQIKFGEDVVLISISDQGKGMTPDQVDRIFEKFYRTDEAQNIQGTGLGMGIVKYLVTSHTGRIWVESKLNQGTTVTIELPKVAPFWRDEYSVKIPTLDEQHQKIFELISKLSISIREGSEENSINLILNELVRYAEFHFKYEEDLFHKYNYPDTSRHVKGHRYFQHKIDSFKFLSEEENHTLQINIISFLYNWLTNHIMEDDKAYGSFLDQKMLLEKSS